MKKCFWWKLIICILISFILNIINCVIISTSKDAISNKNYFHFDWVNWTKSAAFLTKPTYIIYSTYTKNRIRTTNRKLPTCYFGMNICKFCYSVYICAQKLIVPLPPPPMQIISYVENILKTTPKVKICKWKCIYSMRGCKYMQFILCSASSVHNPINIHYLFEPGAAITSTINLWECLFKPQKQNAH